MAMSATPPHAPAQAESAGWQDFVVAWNELVQTVQGIWGEFYKNHSEAGQQYAHKLAESQTAVLQRVHEAYQAYWRALSASAGDPTQAREAYAALTRTLREQEEQARQTATEAYEAYIAAVGPEGTLSKELQEKLDVAFRTHLENLKKHWASLDPVRVNPAALYTMGQLLGAAAQYMSWGARPSM